MKKILFVLSILITFSCGQEKTNNPPTNGFGPYDGQSVFLGDESTVDVFKTIDAAWAKRDYDTLKTLIADGGLYIFEDGYTATTAQEFVDKIEKGYLEAVEKGEEWSWKIDYAFSVHPKGSGDPKALNQEGQWVNAQFTSGDAIYIEWYQIVDRKLKMWYQSKGNYTIPE